MTTPLSVTDFDYALPPELIAQFPLPERSASAAPPRAVEAAVAPLPAEEPPVPADTAEQAASTTLRAADNDLILRTVRALNGNISKTAEQLGVSRGLVYRRLREARDSDR